MHLSRYDNRTAEGPMHIAISSDSRTIKRTILKIKIISIGIGKLLKCHKLKKRIFKVTALLRKIQKTKLTLSTDLNKRSL